MHDEVKDLLEEPSRSSAEYVDKILYLVSESNFPSKANIRRELEGREGKYVPYSRVDRIIDELEEERFLEETLIARQSDVYELTDRGEGRLEGIEDYPEEKELPSFRIVP